jgi:anti-sigma factor (TIGR02949 family)
MNCQEALNQLYEIIDKEAQTIDEQSIREHLSHCRHCADIYKLEEAVNDFILARLRSDGPPPKLATLKEKILSELDAADCDDQPCTDETTR